MEIERFLLVQELYLSALERNPAERLAFLAETCGHDSELLREVESLLLQPETGILDHPVWDAVGDAPPEFGGAVEESAGNQAIWQPSHLLRPGERVGRYRVVESLGTGGMAAVYKAEDLRLGRTVALKLMLSASLGKRQFRQRFLREARAIAALDHINVCTVYEVEEDRGRLFLVMAYVDGPSIAAVLELGALGVAQAIDIGLQVAEGLAESHRMGIVHRDLKPSNILLTKKGVVKIVDFGLASLLREPRITEDGTAMGTPAYAAPEQWLGMEPDPRADIWSLGMVLWEMLTGAVPLVGIQRRVLDEGPLRLRDRCPDAPGELEGLLAEMLVENLDLRLSSAEHASERLRALKQRAPIAEFAQLQADRMLASARRHDARKNVSIAVLPFENMAPDKENEYFSDGITEELITGLSKIDGLRVVSRASSFWFKGKEYDPRAIGTRLNVRFLVTGSVRKTGNSLRLRAELIGTNDGYQIWNEVYQRELRDIFAVQEELAGAILAALRIELSTNEPQAFPHRKTPNVVAYQLYLQGLFYWNKRSEQTMRRAIEFFQRAMDDDPLYPQPYCGLADALILSVIFGWLPPDQAMRRAKRAAEQALEIDPYLAAAHVSVAMIRFLYDWDIPAATAEFGYGMQLDPSYAIGRSFHAFFLLWTGRDNEALKEMHEAQESDPLSLAIMTNIGWFNLFQRKYEEAVKYFRSALDLEPEYVRANLYLGTALVLMGRFEEGIESTRKAVARSAEDRTLLLWLAFNYAVSGRGAEADGLLRSIAGISSEHYFSSAELAIVYSVLGDQDSAADMIRKAGEERCPLPIYLRDPRADWMRADVRVQQLLGGCAFGNC